VGQASYLPLPHFDFWKKKISTKKRCKLPILIPKIIFFVYPETLGKLVKAVLNGLDINL
jgi:hypothetical protein